MAKPTRVPRVPIIGFLRGKPLYMIAGGDPTNTREPMLTAEQLQGLDADALTAERTRTLDLLDDTSFDGDVNQLAEYGVRIAEEIDARQARLQSAQAARTRLAGADPSSLRDEPEPNDPGNRTRRPAQRTNVRETVDESPGAQFVRSDVFTQFAERGYSGQAAFDAPIHYRALFDSSGTSAGAFVRPTRVPDVIQVAQDRPLRLADLIDRRPSDTNALEYVQEQAITFAAAEVAEGGVKPETTWTLAVITDTLRTVAHFVNITRQTAEDNSQVQGYIEGRLAYGLERRLDGQILDGNGTAPNLRGILQTAGIGTYVAAASEAAIISVRKAITVAQLSEYDPDTVALRPTAWERIELSTDTTGEFRVTPNPAAAIGPRIWGLNVVTTMAMAALTGLVGNFREGATLWEREGVRILMTDSHASNFTSNILTILAEFRAGLSVWRPLAFVKVTFDAAGN